MPLSHEALLRPSNHLRVPRNGQRPYPYQYLLSAENRLIRAVSTQSGVEEAKDGLTAAIERYITNGSPYVYCEVTTREQVDLWAEAIAERKKEYTLGTGR